MKVKIFTQALTKTFILIFVFFAFIELADAQITRDVGDIAVIEGDDEIIYTPTDSDGNPCLDSDGNPYSPISVKVTEVAKKFYQTHDDAFQFLTMFTNFDHLLAPDETCKEQVGAQYVGVFDDVKGIGKGTSNKRKHFGESKVLESFLKMNNIHKWPKDPTERSIDNYSILSLMAQELGHRWLAYIQFDSDPRPEAISASNKLLGRGKQHWSALFHTASITSNEDDREASSMEGNFWVKDYWILDAADFRSTTITDGYSPLDLYLMGLLPATCVEPFWFIAGPKDADNPSADETPGKDLKAQGLQRFVTLQDVIEVEGHRDPDFSKSPKVFRQAFILLTLPGKDATPEELDRIERYRVAWEKHFAEKTQHRGAVITDLDNRIYVDRANTGEESGTFNDPYNTIREGRVHSAPGGTIVISTGNYPENLTLTKPLKLKAVNGSVSIGK